MSTQVATILQEGKPFLVGEWLVEPKLNRVSRGDVTVQLELKAMDVLLCLVDRGGDLVSKHELFDAVWQTEFVCDNTLTNRIAQLRNAFGDDAHDPRYIETIRKRGYRLIAEVGSMTMATEPAPDTPEAIDHTEEEPNPYPGLAAFTEADADRFYGRETEVAALWRKISSRRLLAVIGPSGVGKSSLLRAGVAARTPPGWRVVVFTPGENPTLSLARALAPDHAGDPAAMARLLSFNDSDTALAVVSRWQGQFDEAVLIVDQFEELFTLNPPEVQAAFIALMRRLVDAADVRVVLGMRDDFLHHCQPHPSIAPIFESLTPIGPPDAAGLRRALKEPAARLGHRFETETLVDRVIGEVEGERGALPLMAFAVHRLWEERDSERRTLTEEAYEHIGGVSGALARHADTTLEKIGMERLPIVRELFRNLVTAEGTRAVREVDELLSVFSERSEADEVLRELVNARLLTSYKHDQEEGSLRRVEIVHESLLTSWPRLVRWQTQDADSAQIRDELRQAARMWDDHDRAKDYLWTGKAFKEFDLWREGYPGGLTELEAAFASAMTSNAGRQRRRRRLAAVLVFGALLAVLTVVGTLWLRSVRETRRAEAAKLLALGQLRLEDYPTATLAHAIASLELADTAEARILALRALWKGPSAFIINRDTSHACEFTPDGEWLLQSIQREDKPQLAILARDGHRTAFDEVFGHPIVDTVMNPEGTVVFAKPEFNSGSDQRVVLWSIPDGRRLCDARIAPPAWVTARVVGWNRDRCLALVWEDDRASIHAFGFDGTHERLGRVDLVARSSGGSLRTAIDLRTGRWFAFVKDHTVSVCRIDEHELSPPRVLGRHEGSRHRVAVEPDGRFVATATDDGTVKIWAPGGSSPPLTIEGPEGIAAVGFFNHEPLLAVRTESDGTDRIWLYSFTDGDPLLLRTFDSGPTMPDAFFKLWGWDHSSRRFAKNAMDQRTRLWQLSAPSDAEPLALRRGNIIVDWWHSFHPEGRWLATADNTVGLMMWPLSRSYPSVIRSHLKAVWGVKFGPRGEWLASGDLDGIVRISPLGGQVPAAGRVVGRQSFPIQALDVSPDGSKILVGGENRGAVLIPIDGDPVQKVSDLLHVYRLAFSPDGRVTGVTGRKANDRIELQVLAADTLERIAAIETDYRGVMVSPCFLSDGRVVFVRESGLYIAEPRHGTTEILFEGQYSALAASEDGRRVAVVGREGHSWDSRGQLVLFDMDSGTTTRHASHGDQLTSVAMDAAGDLVATGDAGGVVRIGPETGEEPHLLLGHEGGVRTVDIDPLGRWIATGGQDGTVRIWPMPDLSKPPLHTLPHGELLTKLKTLTNLRLVRDKEDPTGWTLTHEPFPGWETVPTW